MQSINLKRLVLAAALAAASLAFAHLPAHAAVVFSNFGEGDSFSGGSAASIGVFGASSEQGSSQRIAAAFTPTAAFTLSSADVAMFHIFGANDYTAQVMTDTFGTPSEIVIDAGSLVDTVGDTGIYTFTFGTAATLAADTPYWLVIRPTDLSGDTEGFAKHNNIDQDGYQFNENEGGWQTRASRPTPAFRINGAAATVVPESSTLALVAPALSIVVASIVKRRRK